MSSPPGASDAQIRAKLLNRLGIYDPLAQQTAAPPPLTAAQARRLRILRGMGVGYTLRPSPPDGSAPRHPLGNAVPYKDKLRCDDRGAAPDDAPRDTAAAPPRTAPVPLPRASSAPVRERRRRIAFQEEVDIVPIPTRHEYSDRIKSRIWSSRLELQENAERNAREYAAEGWDWRGVTEDEGMFICSVSGELVHPIHLQAHLQAMAAHGNGGNQHHHQEEAAAPGLERGAPVHSN